MIKRVRDDVLTGVQGSGSGPNRPSCACKCGSVCPCMTDVDGATNYVTYNTDMYANNLFVGKGVLPE